MSWAVTSASQIGSVHQRDHRPLQDSSLTWSDGEAAIIAVADGHGHHLHFRSDVGADLATHCAVDALREALPHWAPESDLDRPTVEQVAATMLAAWTAAVHEHVAAHPFSQADGAGDPLTPYGTTLIAMGVAGNSLVALQIGDGDAVAVRANGEALRPLPDDPRQDGVVTASLCQPGALESLRCTVLDLEVEDVVLGFLCSDGFGGSRVDAKGWWQQTGDELVQLGRQHGPTWLAEQLPSWLEEPALVGGDDTTMAILARSDMQVPDTVPVPLP
jgi:hypothetical protein